MPLRPINAIFVHPKNKQYVVYHGGHLWQLPRMKLDLHSWAQRIQYKGGAGEIFLAQSQQVLDSRLSERLPTEELPQSLHGVPFDRFESWWRVNGYDWLKAKQDNASATQPNAIPQQRQSKDTQAQSNQAHPQPSTAQPKPQNQPESQPQKSQPQAQSQTQTQTQTQAKAQNPSHATPKPVASSHTPHANKPPAAGTPAQVNQPNTDSDVFDNLLAELEEDLLK